MTLDDINQTIQQFADGARRARQAGLDGVELHSANGYLFTQFLSSAINDRTDEYGGSLENRARFLLDVVRAIRKEVGDDFHLQAKISATESINAIFNTEGRGNTIQDSVPVCSWLEQAGVDAIHVSGGGYFPHPRNPVGHLPIEDFVKTYGTIIASGENTFRNYLLFHNNLTADVFKARWEKAAGTVYEGVNLADAHAIKQAVNIPVICTGGFQTASFIRSCDSGRRVRRRFHCEASDCEQRSGEAVRSGYGCTCETVYLLQ